MYTKVEFFNTPIVEGRKILSYKGFVHASQVAGTGFLTDFMASFSDFFGGNSGVYRSTMNELQSNVFRQLEKQATEKGANAIIGVHVDFDSISSKGMSMFMVSAQGTAVVLDEGQAIVSKDGHSNEVVDLSELTKKEFINRIAQNISVKITEEDWKSIIQFADVAIANDLHAVYCKISKPVPEGYLVDSRFVANYEHYFSKIPYEKQVELAYKTHTELDLIKKFNLFNAQEIFSWAKKGELSFAIDCLYSDKDVYNKGDLKDMEELCDYFENLPDKGKIEEVKGGVFSSGGQKFICECGKKNDKNVIFCEYCGKNIKGVTRKQIKAIETFKSRVSILKELIEE